MSIRKADELSRSPKNKSTFRKWISTIDKKKSINELRVHNFEKGYIFILQIKYCEEPFPKDAHNPWQRNNYIIKEYITKSSINKAMRIGLHIIDTNKCYNLNMDKTLSKLPKAEAWT